MDLTNLAQFVLSGLTTGCVYALVALGFVLCANVSGVVNFAQGEYVMLGGMIATVMVGAGVPIAVAIVAAVVAGGALGLAQERFTVAPIRRSAAFVLITITLGISVVLRGIALLVWGKDPYSMPSFAGGEGVFVLFGARLPWQTLWVWGVTAGLLLATFWFLKFTMLGRAVRACSINHHAARLMGVETEQMNMLIFALAGAAGALGGLVIAPITLASYSMGLIFGLKGFIGAIIGGFRNPVIAVAGGLGLGIVESLGAGYVSSAYKDAFAYGILLVFLFARGGVFALGRAALTGSEEAHA